MSQTALLCDPTVVHFMEITGSNYETASTFLSNSKYEIQPSLNAFFESYAPLITSSSEEESEEVNSDSVMEIYENKPQERGLKRPSIEMEPLIISSDEEEDPVIFVCEQKAKQPKLSFAGCSSYLEQSQPSPPKHIKRKILIDGSNVAFTFGKSFFGKNYDKNKKEAFSVEGIHQCITYFEHMGFDVKVVVPEFRLKYDKSSNCGLFNRLNEEGYLIPTPAKSYDDAILLESAMRLNAAVVSNDFFREYLGFCCIKLLNGYYSLQAISRDRALMKLSTTA